MQKHLLYVEISKIKKKNKKKKTRRILHFIFLLRLRILNNSKFILTATSFGTNGIVVTRLLCIYDRMIHAYSIYFKHTDAHTKAYSVDPDQTPQNTESGQSTLFATHSSGSFKTHQQGDQMILLNSRTNGVRS